MRIQKAEKLKVRLNSNMKLRDGGGERKKERGRKRRARACFTIVAPLFPTITWSHSHIHFVARDSS
jgi:hypothetical protein